MTEPTTAKKGKRYTPQEKAEAIAFVAEHNKANKRGGQKAAAEKFGITTLTISNWLKAAKSKGAAKKPDAVAAAPVAAPKVAKKKAGKRGRPAKKKTAKEAPARKAGAKRGRPAATGFNAKLNKLASLNDEIAKTEAGLGKLKAEFAKLKASL